MWDVLSVGELLLDLVAETAGTLGEVERFVRMPGGTPANVAVGVSRAGGRAAVGGAVGSDPFGRWLVEVLSDEGVNVSGLTQVEARTGVVFITRDGRGHPAYYSPNAPAAELRWGAADAGRLPVEAARILHFGTRLLLGDESARALTGLVERARSAGTFVAFDPNVHLHLWRDPALLRQASGPLFASADVVKLSASECGPLTGRTDPKEAAQFVLDAGARLVVVTLGEEGAVFVRRSAAGTETGRIAARPITAVDAAGAGDAFMAVLLTAFARRLAEGEDPTALSLGRLERAFGLASEAGARVCQVRGAMAGLPSAGDLAPVEI